MQLTDIPWFLMIAGMCLAHDGFARDGNPPDILSLTTDAKPAEATIEDVAWISGIWQGEAFGGLTEEIWAPPQGHAMVGMFRLVTNDQVKFYELLTIAEEGNSLVLRLKHFDPGLQGWEEKDEPVTFPLVEVSSKAAFFDGMTFRKLSADTLQISVAQRGKDGTPGRLDFEFTRGKDLTGE
ncbi:DUF6265 family protein [Candidatus Eisenbacteria bacterium]|uniref:DUF6265 family protein n=1 Tax=Eiseniibacteriota bacterium TaxID=2212470 RepID=A0ABV6YJM0_UNCEI